MDLLNQLYTRLSDQVRSMTPGSRAIAGLLLMVVIISLGYLCVYSFGDSNKSASAPQPLAAERQSTGSDDPMEEAIRSDKPWILPDTRDLLQNTAKEKVLAKEIIDFFTDIEQAKVKLSYREELRRGRTHKRPIASVCIKMKPDKKLGRDLGVMICNYVADASGRDPVHVTVRDPSHRTSYRGSRERDDAIANHTNRSNRRALEQDCQEKIRRLLSFIPELTVVVSVQPNQIEQNASPNIDSLGNMAPPNASAMTCNRPRHLPNMHIEKTIANNALEPGPYSEEFVDSHKSNPTQNRAATPIRVSIRVPDSYFKKLHNDQKHFSHNPSPEDRKSIEAREIERIKQLAASVLPTVEGIGDRTNWITVVPIHDDNPSLAEIHQAPSQKPSRYASWPFILGAVALGLGVWFALRMFRRYTSPHHDSQNADETKPDTAEGFSVEISHREDSSGIELDGQLARRIIERHREANESSSSKPFGLLHKTDAQRIARILADELPQTVALVLSHLSQRQAGDVLGYLSPETQVDVIRRLVDLEQTDPEVLREIEATLAARLSEQVPLQSQRMAGLKAVGRILEASQQPIRHQILDNLAARDERLAAEFGPYVAPHEPGTMSFEDLAHLDPSTRHRLWEAADEQIFALALVGASEEITVQLLEGLSREQTKAIRRSLDRLQPTRLSDIDAAREELIELAQTLTAEPSSVTA